MGTERVPRCILRGLRGQTPLSVGYMFVKFVCVASVSVFRGNPCRETKNAVLCGKTPDANLREAHAGSADMHFTWPAWDKTHSRLALFAEFLWVASVFSDHGRH